MREVICAPLKIDSLFFGAPDAVMDRIAAIDIEFNPDIPMPPADALVWQVIPVSLQPLCWGFEKCATRNLRRTS